MRSDIFLFPILGEPTRDRKFSEALSISTLRIILLIFSFIAPGITRAEEPVLPPECTISGSLETTGRVPEGMEVRLKGPLPPQTPVLVLKGRTGGGRGLGISLMGPAETSAFFTMKAIDHQRKGVISRDAGISLGWEGKGGGGRYFVRPNPSFYRPEEFEKRRVDWEKLPGASEHVFTLVLRPSAENETQVWLDGQFMQILPSPLAWENYQITLYAGAVVESLRLESHSQTASLSLPISANPRAGGIVNARLKFDAPTSTAFEKLADKEIQGIGVGGLGIIPGLATDDLQSFFWRRHATNQLPEQRMFSIPLAVYDRAWVLCAAEPDRAKVNSFTLRVTRYGGSRGNAMADSLVKVPAANSPDTENARRVGTVCYGSKENRKTVPLWLVRVPIRNGSISDLLSKDQYKDPNVGTHRYLDVDLLDPLENSDAAYAFPPSMHFAGRSWRPTDPNYKSYDYYGNLQPPATSGITIFGIELEKSPASLEVTASTGIQAFYSSEKPKFAAKVIAREAGNYLVKWTFTDVSGMTVDTGEENIPCFAGSESGMEVPLKQDIGWYAARFQLVGLDGRELFDYRTSFVMLPPDTRKAGYESPFYGWWFQKNQRSDIKLAEVGPLLQRLGIRRAMLPENMPESLTQQYGFTNSTVSYSNLGGARAMKNFRDGKATLEEAVAFHEADIRHQLELWPSIDRMLVFHESRASGAPFPRELWGEASKDFQAIQGDNSPEALLAKEGGEDPDAIDKRGRELWQRNWPKRLEYLAAMSQMVREKFPGLKMQYGNDGDSLALMGELFRQKFPRKWIDTMAVEDLGQTFAPEHALIGGLHSAWFLRETARKMGYGDIPITACTEWIGRMTERLGLKTQAEWKVRDGLIALAYGFDTISIAGINDASSGYYYSIWANGGLCDRYPLLAPKPAYAAVAILTQILDRAEFSRFIPTGSSVLYLQEFRGEDGWIYPFWTPRGEREVTVEFPDDASRTLTDLYGRTKDIAGATLKLKAGTGVQYLVSKTQINRVSAGKSAFPEDVAPVKPTETILLESVNDVSIASDKNLEEVSRRQPWAVPMRTEGKFELREVEDPEMGRCLEVELKPEGAIKDVEHEYVYLKLTRAVETDARNAGIWIKGNGSWGQVDIWKSRPWGPWATNGNLQLRWPGTATLNFDGWSFIKYPYYDWVREGQSNSIRGLVIFLPRKVLVGTELAPVENLKVRIKSIVLF